MVQKVAAAAVAVAARARALGRACARGLAIVHRTAISPMWRALELAAACVAAVAARAAAVVGCAVAHVARTVGGWVAAGVEVAARATAAAAHATLLLTVAVALAARNAGVVVARWLLLSLLLPALRLCARFWPAISAATAGASVGL